MNSSTKAYAQIKECTIKFFTVNYIGCILLLLPLILGGCFCFGGPGCEPTNPCDDYCPCTDGKNPMSNIARWDGSQWLPLGSGVNGKVEGIVLDSAAQELYVFGSFTNAGGISVSNQAKWSEKTQTWSAIGTQLNHPSHTYVSSIIANNGKIYYCNFLSNKLYNSDGTFVEGTGLFVWDGINWRTLLRIIDGQNDLRTPVVRAIIGTTLYMESQSYKDATDKDGRLYMYDLISNQIVDSLPDRSPTPSFGYVHFSQDGIFTNEIDGIYRYINGIRKKIIQVEIGSQGYTQISSSSEYVSLWNYYLQSTSPTGQKHMIIYDIKADTTFNEPVIPLDPAHRTQQVYATKVSGHTLFVGGAFYLKDGGADVRNIGAYDLRQNKWYDLAGGVCGPVHAIAEMNGSMYVGGEFSTLGKK